MQQLHPNATNEKPASSMLPDAVQRLIGYGKRHGLSSIVGRAVTLARRALFQRRFVVYLCELKSLPARSPATALPGHLQVSRVTRFEDIPERDWLKIISDRTPAICRKTFHQRFEQGSTLWLIHHSDQPAGYGWTIAGRTIEPFYFRLENGDVHFFDFMVFAEHRGKQVNPNLVNFILSELAREGWTRAYIDVAEWNDSQFASLAKTFFQRLGFARKPSWLSPA